MRFAYVFKGKTGRGALIERNASVLGGKPVIAGTRISVEFILELIASGMTPREIAQEYKLPLPSVQAALRYAVSDFKREETVVFAPA